MSSAIASLNRLRTAIERRAPLLDTFAPGASPERWTSFRTDLQLEPPDAFEALHSWRDGMVHSGFYGGERAIAGQTLLGLDEVLRVKATWDDFAREGATKSPLELADQSHLLLWSPSWIPLSCSDRVVTALSTVACFGGPPGQVIEVHDEIGARGWRIAHASFAEWLEALAIIVESDLAGEADGGPKIDAVRARTSPGAFSVDVRAGSDRFDTPPTRKTTSIALALVPGARARIVRGKLASTDATVVDVQGDGVRVEVSLFGRTAIVTVAASDLEGRA